VCILVNNFQKNVVLNFDMRCWKLVFVIRVFLLTHWKGKWRRKKYFYEDHTQTSTICHKIRQMCVRKLLVVWTRGTQIPAGMPAWRLNSVWWCLMIVDFQHWVYFLSPCWCLHFSYLLHFHRKHSSYPLQRLRVQMLVREIIVVCCTNHAKHVKTLWWQNAKFLNVAADDAHSYH
jgi:hypothetical protein